ncbi:CBS domain-containing protein [bacterium]|nr:CBS domain-containing protein [bacterium]
MSHFATAGHTYHTTPVVSVNTDTDINLAYERILELDISSLAVVDHDGKLVGVLSRSDLLKAGTRQAGSAHRAPVLTLPNTAAGQMMTSPPITISVDQPLKQAAQFMVQKRIHRVYTVDGEGRPQGVISTRDLMLAVRDQRLNRTLEEYMSSPVFSIRAEEPISEGVHRLAKAHVSGLVVLDHDWPVGVFTQRDALLFQNLARTTPVEEAMDPSLLILPPGCKLYRAAAQAAAMKVRRILVSEHTHPVGILTGLDFAKAVLD